MTFLITFEQDTLHFRFALGLTNYAACLIRLMVLALLLSGDQIGEVSLWVISLSLHLLLAMFYLYFQALASGQVRGRLF